MDTELQRFYDTCRRLYYRLEEVDVRPARYRFLAGGKIERISD